MNGTTGLMGKNMPILKPTQISAKRSITLIIRIVGEGCNLKCGYCWFRNHDQSSPIVMSYNVVERVISEASLLDQPSYTFVWLGGEPLLAGVDFFHHIDDCQKQFLKGKKIRNRIQTNALSLDDRWINFLLYSTFKIGISIDGPKDIHDHYRIDADGKGSFGRVYENLKKCQAAGIKFGAIATITNVGVQQPERIFDFFVDNGIKGFGLNFVYEVEQEKPLPFSVTVDHYAEFMIRIFDMWMEADDANLRIREIDNFLVGLFGGRPRGCMFNGSCGNFFSVGINGEIFPCERLPEQTLFGNLIDTSLQSCLASPEYHQHKKEVGTLPAQCNNCRWLNACRGGCTHYRNNGNPIFCSGNKKIFQHIANRLN